MAEIEYTSDNDFIKNRSQYIVWSGLSVDDTGSPLQFAGHADKTVHVFGTWDGASVIFEGSNDPRVETDPNNAAWATMNDPQAIAFQRSSDFIDMVVENPRYMRPRVSGGGGSTNITIILCCKSPVR